MAAGATATSWSASCRASARRDWTRRRSGRCWWTIRVDCSPSSPRKPDGPSANRKRSTEGLMAVFPSQYLYRVYHTLARRLGADDEEARIFAHCYVTADLRGKDTQGIACLPVNYGWIRNGAARFG